MSDWTPETNRIQTMHLTGDELARLKAAKHGWIMTRGAGGWYPEDAPIWLWGAVYRAKPAPAPTLSITVNGVTNVVASPVTEALADGQSYWSAQTEFEEFSDWHVWKGTPMNLRHLERGLVHTSRPAARAHAMAMVGLKAEGV